jgi:hypothetical protein
MRLLCSLLIWPYFAAADPFPEAAALGPVPAAIGTELSRPIALPDLLSSEVIRLVDVIPSNAIRSTVARRVFAFDITKPADCTRGVTLIAGEEPIPAESHWPDSHDRITVGPPERGNMQVGAGIRNPWEVRVHSRSPEEETVLTCGGIIGAGDGNSVALLNGRLLRRGETLGEFNIAWVRANEVVLERNGTYLVIPRGRRVTVTTTVR